ncbi:MAG: hypothetical protein K2N17_02180, partial [Clostridia bacterium]|nr:hypothetical protein [Clostridia bacterium]
SRLAAKVTGGGVIYEHELLEILLFYACPRRDLNATAHALIERFGSLGGVLSAKVDDLNAVEGVGCNMAEYLAVLGMVFDRIGGCNSFAVLGNTAQFKEFLALSPRPENDRTELCMVDKDGRVRRMCAFGKDVADNGILKLLSVHKPYGLFVAARRAVGGCIPGSSDDKLTARIYEIARLCGVRFFDYCVVSEAGEIYSYKTADRSVFGAYYAGGNYGE